MLGIRFGMACSARTRCNLMRVRSIRVIFWEPFPLPVQIDLYNQMMMQFIFREPGWEKALQRRK